MPGREFLEKRQALHRRWGVRICGPSKPVDSGCGSSGRVKCELLLSKMKYLVQFCGQTGGGLEV